jgi:hypothetical protein
VLRRENVKAAYERVVRNGGAAGVDGMTVDGLMPYCREHWCCRSRWLRGSRTDWMMAIAEAERRRSWSMMA